VQDCRRDFPGGANWLAIDNVGYLASQPAT
jgi:hypothetical protein